MAYEIEGKILKIEETKQITETFKKREFVIEKSTNVGGNVYTDTIKFQTVQDRVDILNSFAEGQEVKVSFNIRGNSWVRDGIVNYFNNLDAWKIDKLVNNAPADIPPPVNDDVPPEPNNQNDESFPF